MPKVRRGPDGPTSSAGGAPGTNRPTPHPSSGTSGMSHESSMTGGDKKYYGGGAKKSGKGYS
jgi:hypothetical protein